MKQRTLDAEKLDISSLVGVTDLTINNIRQREISKLAGLDELPLNSLMIRWLSSPDLTSVPLPKSLVSLTISHSTKLKSLVGLKSLPRLKELYLRENGTPFDISEISILDNLEHLIIDGGYGGGQTVLDLSPLEGLPISELTFINIKGEGLDFGPIARLTKLQKLNLPNLLTPADELAKIAAAKDWFYDDLTNLPVANSAYAKRCKKCNELPHELFLKGKKWHWCLSCQHDAVKKHMDAFDKLVVEARELHP